MINRFKVLVAALGLVVAAGTIGEASAATVTTTKIVASHGLIHKKTTKVVTRAPHRVYFGSRVIKHVRIVHRAPTLVKIVKAPGHKTLVSKTFVKKSFGRKIVRIVKAPLVKHAMLHRAGTKVTVIR